MNTQLMLPILRFYLATIGNVAPKRTNYALWKLFSRPKRRSSRVGAPELLAQAMQLKHEYQGHSINGYLWGQGARQVFLAHGWQSHAMDFKHLIPALVEAGYQVIGFDMPAHGDSEGKIAHPPAFSDVWSAVFDKLGAPYAVIAHSMGANAMTHVLSTRWEGAAVQRFVALAPPTDPPSFFYHFCKKLGLGETRAQELIAMTKEITGFSPLEFVMFDRFDDLNADQVMLAYDQDDRTVPQGEMLQLKAAWKGAHCIETKGLRHNGLLKDEALRTEILQFLA
ncbi:MAG: alpha/beta hydrolase [Bacteroidia bacterium]